MKLCSSALLAFGKYRVTVRGNNWIINRAHMEHMPDLTENWLTQMQLARTKSFSWQIIKHKLDNFEISHSFLHLVNDANE